MNRTNIQNCAVTVDEVIKVHCPTKDSFIKSLIAAKENQIFVDCGKSTSVAWFEVTGGVTFFSPQFDKPDLSEVVRLLDTVNMFDEIPVGAADAAMEM
jgi:hypothetical protein